MNEHVKTASQVKVMIDDQEVLVEPGTLLIEAAKKIGVEVPHFCYHRKLKPDANCRMCLVAVEKLPKLQTACSTPVADGMIVHTNSPQVVDAQKTVLDFILANHPLDCPVCDQGGRCDLQEYSHQYTAYGRFEETKRVYEKEFFSPLIEKEMNRCVTCLRCVRYCDEVIDSKALAPFNRGTMTEIGHIGNQELDCEFCGGCVQICPVGAFTNRVSMFDFRPWMMKKTMTICNYCGDGCSLALETRDRTIIEVASFDVEFKEAKGRNQGDLCAKGYFGFQYVNSPNRLKMPLVRMEDRLVETSWEEALEVVASNFKRIKIDHGGKAIGGVITARCTNENLYAFQKFMRTVLKSNHVDSSARYGHINSARALQAVQGTSRWNCTYEDIQKADVILIIGSHITEANPIVGLQVKAAVRKHHAKLIVASPHSKHVSTISNILNLPSNHLKLSPGSEGAIVIALIKAVVEQNLIDSELTRSAPEYVGEIKQAISAITSRQLEDVTGVSFNQIKQAAELWAKASRGVLLFGEGINRAVDGFRNVLNLADFAILTGKLTQEGSGLAPLCEENNEQGAIEMGALPDHLPGGRPLQNEEARKDFFDYWQEELPKETGATLMQMIELARQGQIKALYMVGEDPVGTLPASHGVREAIQKADFVVSQDLFLTETGRLSDVVFPAASYAEQSGHFTNSEGRVQPVRRAFDPISDVRPDWEIFSQVSAYMGIPFEYVDEDEITAEIGKILPQWKKMPTREGREASQKRYMSAPPVPVGERYNLNGSPDSKQDRFYLVLGPTLFHSGKMSLEAEGLRKIANEGLLRVNPVDATQLGVKDGKSVKIRSSNAEVIVKVKLDGLCSPGLVLYPDSFKEPAVKDLFSVVLDPVTAAPYFKQGWVEIDKWS